MKAPQSEVIWQNVEDLASHSLYIGQTSQVVVCNIIFDESASDNRKLPETKHEDEYFDVETLYEEDSDSLFTKCSSTMWIYKQHSANAPRSSFLIPLPG